MNLNPPPHSPNVETPPWPLPPRLQRRREGPAGVHLDRSGAARPVSQPEKGLANRVPAATMSVMASDRPFRCHGGRLGRAAASTAITVSLAAEAGNPVVDRSWMAGSQLSRRGFLEAIALLTFAGVLCGCGLKTAWRPDDPQREALALLLPERIEIVTAFTRIRSFDEDDTPDGLELMVRGQNSLGHPGQLMVGDLTIELSEFKPASGIPKGKHIALWKTSLNSIKDQRANWNPVTQMYEFQLSLKGLKIPPAQKYVVTVGLRTPLDAFLSDEATLDLTRDNLGRF